MTDIGKEPPAAVADVWILFQEVNGQQPVYWEDKPHENLIAFGLKWQGLYPSVHFTERDAVLEVCEDMMEQYRQVINCSRNLDEVAEPDTIMACTIYEDGSIGAEGFSILPEELKAMI